MKPYPLTELKNLTWPIFRGATLDVDGITLFSYGCQMMNIICTMKVIAMKLTQHIHDESFG